MMVIIITTWNPTSFLYIWIIFVAHMAMTALREYPDLALNYTLGHGTVFGFHRAILLRLSTG